MKQVIGCLSAQWLRAKRPAVLSAIVAAFVFAGVAAFPNFSTPQMAQDELRIELTGSGFTPAEVQHSAGTFAIAVENSTLSGTYTLRLKADDGTVLKEIEIQKGSAAWTITLQPGQYSLIEAAHPEWLCRITVQ